MNLINEFILAMESCYREFDSSAFIAIAEGSLYKEGVPVTIDVNNDIYGRSISSAINDLSDVWVNTNELAPFIRNIEQSERFGSLGQRPRLANTDIKFNLDYLKDYNDNLTSLVGQFYQSASEGTLDSAAISTFMRLSVDDLSDTVKKQIVRSSLATLYVNNPKALVASNEPLVEWSKEYLKTFVIPFITSFNSLKATTIQEAKMVTSIINDALSSANVRNQKVAEICAQHPEYAAKLNQCNYKINRNLIDVVSFVTYAMLMKLHAITSNAVLCNDALTKMTSTVSALERTINESVYGDSIVSDATGEVADQLMTGDSSAYDELSHNVLEFHKGMIINRGLAGMEDPDGSFDHMIDEREYRKDSYNSVMEVLSEISASLDKISASSDDYLLVTDELIEKAGLDNPIDVRYAERIKMTSDTSNYDKACEIAVNGDGNMDIYATILHEIKDFPENLQTIAKLISDDREKMNILEKRFSDPVAHPWKFNDDFKNTAAITELKVFVTSLKEQYGNLINMIAGNMMSRLKKLAVNAERISVKMDAEDSEPIGVHESVDDIDYALEMDKILYEYQHGVTDILMSTLQESYQDKWNEVVRGIRPIYEISDVTAGNGPVNTNSTNANGTNQAQAAQGVAKAASTIAQKLGDLKNTIAEQFKQVMDKFIQNMNSRSVRLENGQSMVNALWIQQHKSELLNHNYTNQSVQILPYSTKMPWNSILADINTFNGSISALKSSQLANTTEVGAVKKVLGSYKYQISGSTAGEACRSITTPLTNYFKLGKGNHSNIANEIVTYADSNLKAQMTIIANFCEMYYNSGMNALVNSLHGIQNTLSQLADSYVPESVDLMDKLDQLQTMLEATPNATTDPSGGNGQNADTGDASKAPSAKVNLNVDNEKKKDPKVNTDNSQSTTKVFDGIRQAVFTYNGCVLNAVRDRVNDYFRAMTPFVSGNNTPQTQQQANPQQPVANGQPVQQQVQPAAPTA
jgi:hypothetical protein